MDFEILGRGIFFFEALVEITLGENHSARFQLGIRWRNATLHGELYGAARLIPNVRRLAYPAKARYRRGRPLFFDGIPSFGDADARPMKLGGEQKPGRPLLPSLLLLGE